jgi:hypothetical protein
MTTLKSENGRLVLEVEYDPELLDWNEAIDREQNRMNWNMG